MARPHKEGLDYFSFDVDFYDNPKVRKVLRACGPAAGSILSSLLCNIYRWKGYYTILDEDLTFEIADKIGVPEAQVSEVIDKALQVDFFDNRMYEVHKILTSQEIQARYRAGTHKRKEVVISDNYLIMGVRNGVNGCNNPVNGGRSTQSKVKESKVKESINTPAIAGPQKEALTEKEKPIPIQAKQNEFGHQLTTYLPTYGKEMIRAFFDYWSEPDKAGKKMRKELEKTWDLKKRLDRWKANESKFSGGLNGSTQNLQTEKPKIVT
jgi:hypothetical protein